MLDESPTLFIYAPDTCNANVSSFNIKNWGLSCEYEINLVIENYKVYPSLASAACLFVNGHYFHGFINSINDVYSGSTNELHICIISPLSHYLYNHNTKICAPKPISDVLQEILVASGLKDGFDFELIIKNKDVYWWCQINEPSLDFIIKAMNTLGIGYTYKQTKKSFTCVFSDDLSEQFSKKKVDVPILSASGFNQQVEVDIVNYTKKSGFNEDIESMTLTSNMILATPGYGVNLKGGMLIKKVLHINSMDITFGSSSIDRAKLRHNHLIVSTKLGGIATHTALRCRPNASWRRSMIDNTDNVYPDLSQDGEYKIRLHAADESSIKAAGSPLVRNALYFSGNNYGLSYPLHNDTEAILVFENGDAQLPVIIGAMYNADALSVSTSSNYKEGLLKTKAGHFLCFKGQNEEASFECATTEGYNSFFLNADTWLLQSKLGGVKLYALQAICHMTAETNTLLAKSDLLAETENVLNISADVGGVIISATDNHTSKSSKRISYSGKSLFWMAADYVRIEDKNSCYFNAENVLRFNASNGRQDWLCRNGRVYFSAISKIMLKGGISYISITKDKMVLSTPSLITLDADSVSGLRGV